MRCGSVRVLGLFQQGRAFDVGGQHEVDQLAVAAGRLLLDAADARAARNLRHRSALGGDLAADQAEQGGLAGAVAADKADLAALRQHGAGGVEQDAGAEAIGEVGDLQHGWRTALTPSPRLRGEGWGEGQRASSDARLKTG